MPAVPSEDLAIDRKARMKIPFEEVEARRVEERVLRDVCGVAQHGRQALRRARGEVLADDHQAHAGGSQVLLSAGVDQPELLRLEGP